MKTYKFTIIIPVYNVEPYLRECLDSVRTQTFNDWEAICVDDGSVDGSGAILDEYAARDARFRIIHQANSGVSAARNAALDKATGEWIWFVDGDDLIHPESLNWLNDLFNAHAAENPEAFALTIPADNGFRGPQAPTQWPKLCDIKDVEIIDELCSKIFFGFRKGVCGAIIRHDLIGKEKFLPMIMAEDVIFQITYLLKTHRWLYRQQPLYYYRTRTGSAVNSKVSFRKVHDVLMGDIKILSMLNENRDKFNLSAMREAFNWYRNFVWFTFKRVILNLPLNEWSDCAKLWVQLQRTLYRLRPERLPRRLLVALVGFFPTPWLCRFVILLPERVSRLKRRLFST